MRAGPIACLHYKISTLARPATNEFDLPARPADPGDRQRLGRQRRHRQRVTAAVGYPKSAASV